MEEIKKPEAPKALIGYSEWWVRTFGRETTPAEVEELIGYAKSLRGDPEFEKLLIDSVYYDLYSTPKGGNWNEVTYQTNLLTHALSSYGQRFGLQVD